MLETFYCLAFISFLALLFFPLVCVDVSNAGVYIMLCYSCHRISLHRINCLITEFRVYNLNLIPILSSSELPLTNTHLNFHNYTIKWLSVNNALP